MHSHLGSIDVPVFFWGIISWVVLKIRVHSSAPKIVRHYPLSLSLYFVGGC